MSIQQGINQILDRAITADFARKQKEKEIKLANTKISAAEEFGKSAIEQGKAQKELFKTKLNLLEAQTDLERSRGALFDINPEDEYDVWKAEEEVSGLESSVSSLAKQKEAQQQMLQVANVKYQQNKQIAQTYGLLKDDNGGKK